MREKYSICSTMWISTIAVVLGGFFHGVAHGSVDGCGEETVSLVSHLNQMQHCVSLESLTIAWNSQTPLDANFTNLTAVTGNIFLLSLTNVNSIIFSSLTAVGGTVQITALQPHVTVAHVGFPVLTNVGADLILGGETSHFGILGDIEIAITGEQLSVGGNTEIGGAGGSQVRSVRFGNVATLGASHVDDTTHDTTVFRVQTEGLVGDVIVNEPLTSGATDASDGVLRVYGGVLVSIMASTARADRVALNDVVRVYGGITLMQVPGVTSTGTVSVNGIPVNATQDAGVCGGNGVLTSGGLCVCWRHRGTAECQLPTLPLNTVSATTRSDRELNTVNPEDNIGDTSSATGDASADQRRLFGRIPMYAVYATVGGTVLLLLVIMVWRRRIRRRNTEKANVGKTVSNKMLPNSVLDDMDLVWDENLEDTKETPRKKSSLGGFFFRANRKKESHLMPEAGTVLFDAPPSEPQHQEATHSPTSRGRTRRQPGVSGPDRTNSFFQRRNSSGDSSGDEDSPPSVPPRPSLANQNPTSPDQYVAEQRRSSSNEPIDFSLFTLSPGPQSPATTTPQRGNVPIPRKKSRRSSRGTRYPARLAKRHMSLDDVAETDDETIADTNTEDCGFGGDERMAELDRMEVESMASESSSHSRKQTVRRQSKQPREGTTMRGNAQQKHAKQTSSLLVQGSDESVDSESSSSVGRWQSRNTVRRPSNPAAPADGSKFFLQDTEGTASDLDDVGDLGDLVSFQQPPPIQLGRHPSLRHAPEGLRKAVLDKERHKQSVKYNRPTGASARPANRSIAPTTATSTDDIYEVPATVALRGHLLEEESDGADGDETRVDIEENPYLLPVPQPRVNVVDLDKADEDRSAPSRTTASPDLTHVQAMAAIEELDSDESDDGSGGDVAALVIDNSDACSTTDATCAKGAALLGDNLMSMDVVL
eukprot:m.1301441 g.1301441  ORF g.1301441 m.1301441 type:complete len:934 (-) comp24805_c0_seq17:3516-6317(-)